MSKLREIFEHKAMEVAASKVRLPQAEIAEMAADLPPTRGFERTLRASGGIGLIAEVKKASPSQGLIRGDFDPVAVAEAYARAGATCLSVLTDEKYFQGSPENLRRVRGAVTLPLLRKDFIADSYQLYEARLWGADAILLIVAGLDDGSLSELFEEAKALQMDVLVEVHNEEEVERANALGATMIGVNNRDLSTFQTDLATTERLLPSIRREAVKVSESALSTHADIRRAEAAGANAVLIGTAFCAEPDIESKVRAVMGW